MLGPALASLLILKIQNVFQRVIPTTTASEITDIALVITPTENLVDQCLYKDGHGGTNSCINISESFTSIASTYQANGSKFSMIQHPAKGPDGTKLQVAVNAGILAYCNDSKFCNGVWNVLHTILIAGGNMLRTNTMHVGNQLCPQIAHIRIQSNASIFQNIIRCE